MKLPDISQQARPVPTPAGGMARYQTEPLGAAVAPAMALTELGGQIGQMAEAEMKRVDTMRAEEAFNQLRARQQDLTMGEDGFVNQKGSAAINQPLMKNYSTRFDDATNQIAETLGNTQQKELFRQRANLSGLQFRDDLMRHVVREGDVADEQTFKGASAAEKANVASHWNEPDAVAFSVTRIDALVKERAARKGWGSLGDPESFASAVRREEIGNLHESVIDQALASKDYVYAEKWFDGHKDDMDQQTIDRLAPKVENGLQKQLVNGYNTQYLAAMDSGRQLAALEKTITADTDLADDSKNILLGRLQSRRDVLANQAMRAEQHAMNVAQATYTTFQSQVDRGGFINPAEVERARALTKGTPYEQGIVDLANQAKTTGGIAQQPLPVQRNMLAQIDAEIATKGRTEALTKRRDQVAKVMTGTETALKQDGIGALTAVGVVDRLAQIDLSTPQSIAATMPQRLQQAKIGSQYAGYAISPFNSGEASVVKTMIDGLPPQQKAVAVATITASMDSASAMAVSAQLDKQDRPLSLMFASGADMTSQGRYTSELIAKGQQAVVDKLDVKNKFSQTRNNLVAEIAAKVDGAYPDENTAKAVKDAAYYIAMGKAKEGSGRLSDDDLAEAVTLAAGGKIILHNKAPTPIPAGMDEDTFAERIDAVTVKDISKPAPKVPRLTQNGKPLADDQVIVGGVPMPVDDFIKRLPGQALIYAGKGRYGVLVGPDNNKRPVLDSSGRPLLIKVTP